MEVVQSPEHKMFNVITYNFAKRDGNSQTCHEGRHLLALRCLPEAKLDTPLLVSSLMFDKGTTLDLKVEWGSLSLTCLTGLSLMVMNGHVQCLRESPLKFAMV